MTNEQAKNMLKAKLECLKHETSGFYGDCNRCNCDECSLNYEQGNMGEQKQALDMAIKALEQQPCEDTISRQAAIELAMQYCPDDDGTCSKADEDMRNLLDELEDLPSAQPEIIRCKDCKFYSPMNRETKTGICNLIMHQNFGDNWFCAGAERRPDESDRKRSGD